MRGWESSFTTLMEIVCPESVAISPNWCDVNFVLGYEVNQPVTDCVAAVSSRRSRGRMRSAGRLPQIV